ncbi:hypothetical protein NLU13_5591 [Sarocladium strictum]|uniref:Uncharacterized protein n=1 Tax=Sarocladium strictum TaxID=5046 RepID=A0AA39GH66_SARSR|nr:hypothetical protein NLU13_5591 [Sarocladium strictum]
MGAPPLPAPTETETTTPTELTTDLSKPGDDKSTYSLPEDGTPVTIRTRGHKANKSQTSLLIEYFEGGKSGGAGGSSSHRRPSVRVRLTPSKKGKGDHIQLTETKGSRKASLTRRIPLGEALSSRELDLPEGEDAHSMTSYASQTEESNVSRDPIDIEIDRPHRRRRPASPLIPSVESYQPGNPSEISAIPTDSFLDGTGPSSDVKDITSTSRGGALATTAGAAGAGALAGAAINEIRNSKTRSGGKDRVKVSERSKDKSERKHRPKSRKSSVSDAHGDEIHTPRRHSSRTHQESTLSGADSSVVSSNLSPSYRSYDTHSMRSGASRSSINNPKLLETVEDAIRRLILPELSALKREQSKREERRGSLTSTGTSASRDDVSTGRRRSSGRGDPTTQTPRRRNREARHNYGDESPMSVSRDSLNDEYMDDGAGATPSRKGDLLKGALAGAAVAKGISALTDDKSQSERRERRRRRPESARSRSLGRDRYDEEYDEDHLAPVPLMPLMSDINPSEMTRTSILSADSDRPHSATEEMVHDVPRGMAAYPGAEADRSRTPVNLQQTLGTNYANVSTGDLNALPRGQEKAELPPEYNTDEYGRKVPMAAHDYGGDERALSPSDYPEQSYEDQYYTTQDVPPPLKYVPYQAGARGLSPIPSVSGYTEGGSEVQQPRLSMNSDAFPSPDKSEHVRGSRSMHSMDSIPSNMRSREFDRIDHGAHNAGGDYRNTTYTEGSEVDQTNSGQAVRGIAANPNIIHPVSGVESAVASLIDGDQSVLTSGSGYDYGGARDSTLSYDDQSMTKSSRDGSPDKRYVEERRGTPGARSHDQSEEFSEYEIDEHGRKVPRSRYRLPTASEAAITAGAVGAAAAALKKAQEKKQATVQDASEEDFQPAGVNRNKSFKERAMDGWDPRNTPAHSIDRFEDDEVPKMSARALPEAEYMDDDQHTNPSVVQERLDGHGSPRGLELHDEPWSRGATPTPQNVTEDATPTKDGPDGSRGLGITEAVGAAALGAAAGLAAAHSRQASQDEEWHRTSDDRKRDTLLTNPYEDASPIVNPALNENLIGARGLEPGYNAGFAANSPGYGQKYDEGYMSNGPNQTPDREMVPKGKGVDFTGPADIVADDPFYAPKVGRQLSGMSQGMASPFYDASTGQGIERIENKDIIALMQHLMVRDAQRSARDTEIVALLMNAALDMRNSFREMKDLIQETGDDMIFANVENTEKLQKAINGPRPLHSGGPRSMQSASLHATTIDDSNAQKKNLWKRALAGLGAKGSNDLGRIEDMLMQLLGEVDVLKTQTAPAAGSNQSVRGPSADPLQPEGHYEADKGYEPEGVSTASHAGQSGQLAVPPNTAIPRMSIEQRQVSQNRISTVPEGDEEYQYDHPSPVGERSDPNYLTPAQNLQRGASVPLDTPPQQASGSQAALSAENTPRTDKSKSKHKSGSSSGWVPKFSRWSETTASSLGRAFRGNRKSGKYDEYAPPSRSGSSLASYDDYKVEDDYDKLHSGFSETHLGDPGAQPAVRSFTGPQLAPMIPEDPKYKAHRNSLNLQHPQPRPGQTERFRNALEYSAQEYDDPMTPRTAEWNGSATDVARLPPQNTNRYSNASSAAAREPEYWASSPVQQNAPPRPPKEPVEDPSTQTPPRSNRLENRNLSAALGVPSRKPSGPRAMTPKSPEDEAAREERRRKRDTFGTVASAETDTF